jgi:hypothetical protein
LCCVWIGYLFIVISIVLFEFFVLLFLFLFFYSIFIFLVMSYFFVFLCFSCICQRLYRVGPSSPEGAQLNVRAEDFFCKVLNIEFCFVLQFVLYLARSTYPAGMTENNGNWIYHNSICLVKTSCYLMSILYSHTSHVYPYW